MTALRKTRIAIVAIGATLAFHSGLAQRVEARGTWQEKLHQELPLLGHRNWILIVDSAYPLQTSPGVETIETNSDQADVVRDVLKQVDGSIHVRPVLYMDAELPFVRENEAPGVTRYKQEIEGVLNKRPVAALPHEQIIQKIDEAGRTFHVLVLKTNLAVPYTSVFVQLNCKYWGDAAEASLRQRMRSKQSH